MHQNKTIPRQALVVCRELYGSKDHSNTGLKEPAEFVAQRIHELERWEPRRPDGSGLPHIAYTVIDPATEASDGGPSIKERLGKAGIYCRNADNKGVGERGAMGGWDLVRARIRHATPPKGALRPLNTMTLDELWDDHARRGSVRL